MKAQQKPADGMFFRSYAVDKKGIDVKRRMVPVVASTEAIDGHGEIVKQDWDLKRYIANPIVLWNHNSFGQSDKLPIGRSENVRVENQGTAQAALKADIVFASAEANPQAEKIFKLFQEGVLNAVSVGFRPHTVRFEVIEDDEIPVLSDNELLEISAVPAGSNPEALAERRAKEAAWIDMARVIPEPDTEKDSSSPLQRGANPEEDMEIKEAEAALAKAIAERDVANKQLAEVTTERDVVKAQNERLVEERDAAVAKAKKIDAELIAKEVDDLVGKKINPAERDNFVELRTSNPELFAKMIEQRSPMTILDAKGSDPLGADPTPPGAHLNKSDNGEAAAAIVNSAIYGG